MRVYRLLCWTVAGVVGAVADACEAADSRLTAPTETTALGLRSSPRRCCWGDWGGVTGAPWPGDRVDPGHGGATA